MSTFDPRVTRVILTPTLNTNTEQEIRVHPETMETLCAMLGRSRYAQETEAPVLSPAQAVLCALTAKAETQRRNCSWSPEALGRLLRADHNLRNLLENALAGSGVTIISES